MSEKKFTEVVLPIIEAGYRGKGRPPEVSHYKVFCGILYIRGFLYPQTPCRLIFDAGIEGLCLLHPPQFGSPGRASCGSDSQSPYPDGPQNP
jgi:hypothetical protein